MQPSQTPFLPSTNAVTLINPDDDEPFDKRIGRCYELAGNLASHNLDVTLIHGSIQGGGKPRIGHAWIERQDGSIWEPATNKIWARDAFDRYFSAKVDASYDFSAVMRLSVHYRHWGPWDGSTCPIALEDIV